MKVSAKAAAFCVTSAILLFTLFGALAVHGDPQWSAAVSAGVVGACIGSFANVVVYRLPRMMQQAWEREWQEHDGKVAALSHHDGEATAGSGLPNRTLSLTRPACACPHCGATIRCWHNVPVLGFLLLRGRCADCDAPISCRYLFVEATFAAAFAFMGWTLGPGIELVAYAFSFTMLAILVFIDWDTQLLPDCLTQPLLWAGLLFNAGGLRIDLTDAVVGAALGYSTFWLIARLFRLISRREGLGDGDGKLVAALCAWLGWQALPCIMCGAVLSALVCRACRVGSGHTQWSAPQAFGPHLALAGCVVAWM